MKQLQFLQAYLDFVLKMSPVLRSSRLMDFIIWDALSPLPVKGSLVTSPFGRRKHASRNLEANRTPERSQ